ncbi:MAG: aspartyl protease family protein [Erythrobacter sp.]
MLKIKGNAKYAPPIIRIRVLPATPQLVHDPSSIANNGAIGVDCRALLDTGADGTSVTRGLAEAANLSYRGKERATGIGGEGFHRSWTTFLGLYDEERGPLPYLLPEPLIAIEIKAYAAFDAIIGRDVMMLGNFELRSNGDFELQIPAG